MMWSPPGPVAARFYEAQDPIALLMGPIAGAKSTTALHKGVLEAFRWPQDPTEPGVRRAKFAIVRRLWKDLEQTTMKSWFQWYPKEMGRWLGDPPTHTLAFPHPDGTTVELTVEFRAFGDLRIEEALRGYEPSYAFIDEADLAPDNALTFLLSRAARYPRGVLPIAPRMVWGACNAPEEDSYIVRDFIDDPKPGHVLYRQPSGLSAEAENLAVLGRDYYRKLAETLPAFERKRFIENIPGLSRGADLVYEEFNPDLHVAAAALAVLDRPVTVGMDAGGTPAAGLWQTAPNGQRRKIGELSTHAKEAGSITGPTRFAEALAALLAETCRGLPVEGLADPSAAYGADEANDEASWIDTVARVTGIRVRPAPGNNRPSIRMEALRLPMTRMIDGRIPGLLICPKRCPLTVRAYGRDYKWQVTGGKRTGVMKNWASHLVEGDQYAQLDASGFAQATARQEARRHGGRTYQANTEFNPVAPAGTAGRPDRGDWLWR
jgi:hypothetical protein